MRILMLNQAPMTAKRQPAYDVEGVEAQVNSYASPGTRIDLGFPDDFEGSEVFHSLGAESKLNGLHHMVEAPAIIRKIVWAEENGYDAVISSNTFDPGVDGGRLAVSIPVIGPLRTSMHTALTLADRVGITVPLASHVPYTRRILRSYGLEGFVSGMKPIGIYGQNLKQRKAEIFDITVKMIRALVDEGAEIILPLGGAIIPYVVNPDDLAQATGVQVINTKAVCVRFAEMCVAFKMTHSAITYPRGTLKSDDFKTRS
jgi:Asp/Glu/hydantoin racemase